MTEIPLSTHYTLWNLALRFLSEMWAPPPEGDTVMFQARRNSVGSEVCKVCLVGRTERGRQGRGEEAECVWERKNTKQKVRRDNWVGGHETEMYSERVCVCDCVCVYLRITYEILHKHRCQQVHSSSNMKWCIGICVCVCMHFSVCFCVPKDNTVPSLPNCFLQSSTNEESHRHRGNQGQA